MSGCQHHICNDPTGLTCVRNEGHPPGHQYESTSGVADAHTGSSGE